MSKSENINAAVFTGVLSVIIGFNYLYAGMSIPGCAINIIGLSILFFFIITRNIKYLVLFFFLNFMLGPFFLFDFSFLGYSNIGRLDYLVGIIGLVSNLHKEKNFAVKRFIQGLSCLFVLWTIYNLYIQNNSLDDLYGYYAGIAFAYEFYMSICILSEQKKFFKYGMLVIMLIHIGLSIVQLFVPLYLRTGTSTGALIIAGFNITRPVGILSNYYAYGGNTIAAFFIVYVCSDKNARKILKLLFPITLFICIISTRSVLIGFLIFIMLTLLESKSLRTPYFILLIVGGIGIIVYVLTHYIALVSISDQSNGTKLVLWGYCLNVYFTESSVLQMFIGHGVETAKELGRTVYDYLRDIGITKSLDNRINGQDVFPIHNEYLQVLYECGVIIFVYYLRKIYMTLKLSVGKRKLSTLLLCIMFGNYMLHNGFLSDMLIFSICIVLYEYENGYRLESTDNQIQFT